MQGSSVGINSPKDSKVGGVDSNFTAGVGHQDPEFQSSECAAPPSLGHMQLPVIRHC